MQECVNNEVIKGKNIQLTSTVRLKKSGLIRHTSSSLSCPPLVDVSNESRKDDVVGVQEEESPLSKGNMVDNLRLDYRVGLYKGRGLPMSASIYEDSGQRVEVVGDVHDHVMLGKEMNSTNLDDRGSQVISPGTSVRSMVRLNGQWDWAQFQHLLPQYVLDYIASVKPPILGIVANKPG
ncbi:hypothetical protein V6N12_017768 [Hibiscus sabdariffa]|uniref:Uncharacterized protein n=1 Tax=Hibiscus sabdariffa TaxID=183260 RepID=A0ABR2BBL6_9ROSI